jgi:hypothetical protein
MCTLGVPQCIIILPATLKGVFFLNRAPVRRRGRDAFWYLPGKLGVKGHYGNIVLAVLKKFWRS